MTDKNAEQVAWDEAKAGGVKLGRFPTTDFTAT
jgi:hypothetical protein